MRTALILARKYGGKLEVVSGVEVPAHQQAVKFKTDFLASRTNETYEYAELWYSDRGRSKRASFVTAEQVAKSSASSIQAEQVTLAVEDAKEELDGLRTELKAAETKAADAVAAIKTSESTLARVRKEASKAKGGPKAEKAEAEVKAHEAELLAAQELARSAADNFEKANAAVLEAEEKLNKLTNSNPAK